MTTDKPHSADESFDRDVSQAELTELIDHAREADVDLEGAYNARTPQPGNTDHTVEITRLAKHSGGTDRRNSSESD